MPAQTASAVELLSGELVFPLGAGQSPFVVLDVDDAVVLAPGDVALSVRYALSGHVARIRLQPHPCSLLTRSYRESSQAWRLAIQHGDSTYIDSPDQAQRAEIDSAEASTIRVKVNSPV